MSAVVERERTALKATVEPILIREMTMVKRQVKRMELTGTCQEGWTYRQSELSGVRNVDN